MKKILILIGVLILLYSCNNNIVIKRVVSTTENFKYEYKIFIPANSLNYKSVLFLESKLFDKDDQIVERDMLTDDKQFANSVTVLSNKEYFYEGE